MPVHDRDEVAVSLRHRDIGDVGAPNLIHLCHFNIAEKIGVFLMNWRRCACRRLGAKGLNTHDFHEAPDPATSNLMTQLSEFVSQLALPEKWTLHVNYVDEADQLSIATGHFTRWLFESIPIHIEQLTLTPN